MRKTLVGALHTVQRYRNLRSPFSTATDDIDASHTDGVFHGSMSEIVARIEKCHKSIAKNDLVQR